MLLVPISLDSQIDAFSPALTPASVSPLCMACFQSSFVQSEWAVLSTVTALKMTVPSPLLNQSPSLHFSFAFGKKKTFYLLNVTCPILLVC